VASALLVGLPLWHALPAAGHVALLGEGAATVVRLGLVGAALLVAAARAELPQRLRVSLTLIGGTSLVSAVMAVAFVATRVTGIAGPPAGFYSAWAFGSFAVLLLAILRMPMSPPLGRREGRTLPLDLVLSTGGWIAVTWALLAPPAGTAPWNALLTIGTTTVVLVALNLLTLRGRALPSERAFLLFLAGQSSNLVSLFLRSLGHGQGPYDVWADVVYDLGAIPTLWSAWAMGRDPVPPQGAESPVHWVREFNPFAFAMPLVAAAALLHALRAGPATAVWPLALAAAGTGLLLPGRLAITIVENRRRLVAEAGLESRRQHERLEALRRVAGGVAHAFNNSLTVILGETDLRLAGSADDPTRDSLTRIRDAGERIAGLTRHLLWFTGRQHREHELLRTGAWLRALEPDVRELLPTNVTLRLDAPDVPGAVAVDPSQLRVALLELVRNAAAAMPEGGRLTLELSAAGGELGARHRISVRDTGRGIAAEHLSRLFEPFYSPSERSMPDAGMGLALADGVVRAHGGDITVASEPGRGSEFRVELPVAGPESAQNSTDST